MSLDEPSEAVAIGVPDRPYGDSTVGLSRRAAASGVHAPTRHLVPVNIPSLFRTAWPPDLKLMLA